MHTTSNRPLSPTVKVVLAGSVSFVLTYLLSGLVWNLWLLLFVDPTGLTSTGGLNPEPGLYWLIVTYMMLLAYEPLAAIGLWLIAFSLYGVFVIGGNRKVKIRWFVFLACSSAILALSAIFAPARLGVAWFALFQIAVTFLYILVRRLWLARGKAN